MASPAAQRYFDSFSPQDQASIVASWHGMDLMDQWFANAVTAGSVQDDGNPVGTMTPQALRAKAKAEGWSEDFTRPEFTDAVLQDWISKYWDANAGKFRSARSGVSGFWEKPTECPPGLVPGGANETDACVQPGAGGGAGATAQSQSQTTAARQGTEIGYTGNPIVDMLIYQFNNRRSLDTQDPNIFGLTGGRQVPPSDPNGNKADVTGRLLEGGGLWWAPTQDSKDVFGSTTAPTPLSEIKPAPTPTATATEPSIISPAAQTTFANTNAIQPTDTTLTPIQRLLQGQRKKGNFATQYGDLFA